MPQRIHRTKSLRHSPKRIAHTKAEPSMTCIAVQNCQSCQKIQQLTKENLPQKKHTCNHCGAALAEPVHVVHRIVEEIPNRQTRQVIDFLEFEYKCKCCNTSLSARHPDCPPDGIFGKNALIQTTLMKFGQRLPFEKVSTQMESQFALPMTAASAFDITRRVSQYLRPRYFAIL